MKIIKICIKFPKGFYQFLIKFIVESVKLKVKIWNSKFLLLEIFYLHFTPCIRTPLDTKNGYAHPIIIIKVITTNAKDFIGFNYDRSPTGADNTT